MREIDGLSLSEADHAVTAIWQMAVGVVEAQLARQDEAHRNAARRNGVDPLLDTAIAHITQRLYDAELGPESVRRHLGLSRSGLYRLFAPVGGIEAVIRQRRLDDSMRAILTAAGQRVPQRELAARHGFRGEVAFVRAFQSRFGTTPAQFRDKVVAGDRVWLQAQASRAGFASLESWLGALGPAGATP